MRLTNLCGVVALLGCAFTMLLASGLLAADDTEPPAEKADAIVPVRAAETQDEAIRLATEVDLPAIAKANKVVIKRFFDGDEILPEPRQITVDAQATLKLIRDALTVKKTEPSGGETAYELAFYRDDELVREVWVYPYGEWGITRNQGPEWTLGRNQKLADVLDALFEKSEEETD
jgi:hypothetical protein